MRERMPEIVRGDARAIDLPDASVDLIVTSPPYFGLRSYQDGGEHYDGQIGAEATPAEFIAALIACTREWMRVLKPSGSMFVNLGDRYCNVPSGDRKNARSKTGYVTYGQVDTLTVGRQKSLMLLPERYRIAAVDELGLIARAVIVWSKPNGLPESVTDRVRRSHEDWVHLTKAPRYFASVDEIREPHAPAGLARRAYTYQPGHEGGTNGKSNGPLRTGGERPANPLGKLPGSVWEIATQPLRVPESLGVDHFACVDTDTEILTRRGWLRHDQIEIDDDVAGHDLGSGVTSWTRCHAVHRYDFDGELVTVEARGLSMRLTPNHCTLVHDHRGRHRLRGPMHTLYASALTKRHSIPRAVEWVEDGREKGIGADLAALLGWVAAEGWYSNNRRLVYLSQSETVNATKVDQITALLARLGDEPLRTDRDRNWRGKTWRDAQWRLGRALGDEVLRIMPDKLLPGWLADLPLNEARALLDAFVDGDGNRRPDGRVSAFQKYRDNLDVLQAVAVRLGYNTTLKRDESNNRWVLYMNPPRPARLRRADGTSLVGREHYKGVVWCVTTGTGTFVARRNGTVFVTGNSFPMEWPRRLILGWSPHEVCTACGEGRRPVVDRDMGPDKQGRIGTRHGGDHALLAHRTERKMLDGLTLRTITGYACACPDTTAPSTPGVVLDPFGGTGTTALVAAMLDRRGISVDLSADYCRLAEWRAADPKERARAAGLDPDAVSAIKMELPGQESLLDLFDGEAS